MHLSPTTQKWIAIACLIIGEVISVYSEMIAARSHDLLDGTAFWVTFAKSFGLIIVAGALLIIGYMVGFKSIKNIWIVSVLSVTSILVVEPALAYGIFKQLPTKGALIGLIFGGLGFIATLL